MADLDTTLVQEILNVTERQQETDVEHHRQANDF